MVPKPERRIEQLLPLVTKALCYVPKARSRPLEVRGCVEQMELDPGGDGGQHAGSRVVSIASSLSCANAAAARGASCNEMDGSVLRRVQTDAVVFSGQAFDSI